MSVMTTPPWPDFAGAVEPLSALLLYQAEGRILGTLHPLNTGRRGQAWGRCVGAAAHTCRKLPPKRIPPTFGRIATGHSANVL